MIEKLKRFFIEDDSGVHVDDVTPDKISIKGCLMILLFGIPYLIFFSTGLKLYTKTIISDFTLFIYSTILTLLVFIIAYLNFEKLRKNIKNPLSIVIIFVHGTAFSACIFLMFNFNTLNTDFITTKVAVSNWNFKRDRSGSHTIAEVVYKSEQSMLEFEGERFNELKQIDSIFIEMSTGYFGYAYVKDYDIHH